LLTTAAALCGGKTINSTHSYIILC